MKAYLDYKWFDEKIKGFTFDDLAKEFDTRFVSVNREEDYGDWISKSWLVKFECSKNNKTFNIEIMSYGVEILLCYEKDEEKKMCESIEAPFFEFVVNQKDCPLRYAMFGKIKVAPALPF